MISELVRKNRSFCRFHGDVSIAESDLPEIADNALINRDLLQEALSIPSQYSIVQVIALGKPAEKIVIEPMVDGDFNF